MSIAQKERFSPTRTYIPFCPSFTLTWKVLKSQEANKKSALNISQLHILIFSLQTSTRKHPSLGPEAQSDIINQKITQLKTTVSRDSNINCISPIQNQTYHSFLLRLWHRNVGPLDELVVCVSDIVSTSFNIDFGAIFNPLLITICPD